MVDYSVPSEEDEQARRIDILNAARKLLNAGRGTLPTASQVETTAELAEGSVLLYFNSQEEIFATLLLEGWKEMLVDVCVIFEAKRISSWDRATRFIKGFVEHLETHPELLRLGYIWGDVLEKNMNPEALTTYKLDFISHLVKAGDSVDRALGLQAGRGVQILMRTHALTRGLWEGAQHQESDAAVNIPSELTVTPSGFLQEVASALEEYWRGALAKAPFPANG